jgi:peptide chain release factor 2
VSLSSYELRQAVEHLIVEVSESEKKLKLPALLAEIHPLEMLAQSPDFWNNQSKAAEITKKISVLHGRCDPWLSLDRTLAELQEFVEMVDVSTEKELSTQLDEAQNAFLKLKKDLRYQGQYDANEVMISVYAGAGGVDAMDWAGMLYRMYVRWAELHGLKLEVLDQSSGEEAGIKSELRGGSLLYGKLKGEHGVHRLVRLSPFNSDNLRQTSFARVDISPIIDAPEDVLIDEKELKIDVYRSGGNGGQSVNTTDSAVRVTHLPTGIVIAIQNERSQLQNRENALRILRGKLVQLQLEQHAQDLAHIVGPNVSAEWGNQIRSYVLHPYTMVNDTKSKLKVTDAKAVLDGQGLDEFLEAYADSFLAS